MSILPQIRKLYEIITGRKTSSNIIALSVCVGVYFIVPLLTPIFLVAWILLPILLPFIIAYLNKQDAKKEIEAQKAEKELDALAVQDNIKYTHAKYKFVFQVHDYTCGMTCIAILTGKTYNEIFDETKKSYERTGRGEHSEGYIPSEEIRRYLKKYGIKTANIVQFKMGEMKITDFCASKSTSSAILLVKNRGIRSGHFIVSDGKYIYDPEEGIFPVAEYKIFEFITKAIEVI